MKKINIPTYITGTWTNTMHGMGAIRGWLEVQSDHKWLRWHPWQEWFDIWGNPQANDGGKRGTSPGVIAGTVIGSIAGALAIVGAIVLGLKREKIYEKGQIGCQ